VPGTTRPPLAIALNPGLPDYIATDALDLLNDAGTPAALLCLPAGPYAGLELYLPNAVALFIASSYFGGTFKKAGEEHYAALKKAARMLYRRSSGITTAAVGRASEATRSGGFSLVYSIRGEVASGLSFNFVLVRDVNIAEADAGMSAVLDLLRNIHVGNCDTELLVYQPIGGQAVVTYDAKLGRIVPVNVSAGVRALEV
jgi:hypothetical protein